MYEVSIPSSIVLITDTPLLDSVLITKDTFVEINDELLKITMHYFLYLIGLANQCKQIECQFLTTL